MILAQIYVHTYYWYQYGFDMNFKTDIGIDIGLIYIMEGSRGIDIGLLYIGMTISVSVSVWPYRLNPTICHFYKDTNKHENNWKL